MVALPRFVTTLSCLLPKVPAGVVNCSELAVLFVTDTSAPFRYTLALERLVPEIVTVVPPASTPVEGLTFETVGTLAERLQ